MNFIKSEKYYHTRLQFLEIKMQMLQEEYDLLHSEKEYIKKANKSILQMSAQELEDVIYDMETEKKKIEKQYQHFTDLISEAPNTKENEDHRFQITYSMRLTQIRLKKLEEKIDNTKHQRHIKQMEGESHPPSQKSILSVRPKNLSNYPDPTFYKQTTKTKKEDPYTGMFDIPKYSMDMWPNKPKEEIEINRFQQEKQSKRTRQKLESQLTKLSHHEIGLTSNYQLRNTSITTIQWLNQMTQT